MEPDNRPSLTWTEKQALKDQLVERAKYGEITSKEADAEAIRIGLGSLSSIPGPEKFRPAAEAQWTLPMAVAWIAYLDLEKVREWSAPYRAACWDWHWQRWRVGLDGPIHEGWHLEQRSPPTLSLLGISASLDQANGNPPHMTIGEAREALWIALREDFFRASGVSQESGKRDEVDPLDWHELVPVTGKGEVDEVRRGSMGSGYSDILLPSAALQRLWHRPVENPLSLPPLVRPDGDGFMPLYCAAQWIATEGGTIDFPPEDPVRWQVAYDALLGAISADKVRVVGMRGGARDKIDGHVFAGIQVDHPFHNADLALTMGNEVYLRSYAYLDEQHWRNGFDDALVLRTEDKWTQLMVEKTGVRELWPFDAPLPPKSGTPGRPSSSHLFMAEMARRASSGLLEQSLAAESRYLSGWVAQHHPQMPQAKPKAIQAVIRHRYWELKPRK